MGAITFSHGVAGVIGTGLRAASAILDGKQKELLNKNVPEIKIYYFFFFKQKTPYEISECDWSSDVCSSDLPPARGRMRAEVTCSTAARRLRAATKRTTTAISRFARWKRFSSPTCCRQCR